MTVQDPVAPTRADRWPDLLILDPVVTPHWLREHRRAARLAARPDVLAAEIARRVALLTRPGRERTFHELMREQGVTPFRMEEWLQRRPRLTQEEWDEFHAAIVEVKGR